MQQSCCTKSWASASTLLELASHVPEIFVPRRKMLPSGMTLLLTTRRTHSKLICTLAPGLHRYSRNYVDNGFKFGGSLDFDCVTELEFLTPADSLTCFNRIRAPAVQAQILADEMNFLDQNCTRMFAVKTLAS